MFFFLFHIELVLKASKDDSRDFLFYLAVAYYRLKVRTFIQSQAQISKAALAFEHALKYLIGHFVFLPAGLRESPEEHPNTSEERAWEQAGPGSGAAHQ